MKKIILGLALALISSKVEGQQLQETEGNSRWSFILTSSPEFTNVHHRYKENDFFTPAMNEYFLAGRRENSRTMHSCFSPGGRIGIEYQWTERLSVNAGLGYFVRGQKKHTLEEIPNNGVGGFPTFKSQVRKYRTHYVSIPIQAAYVWKVKGVVRFFSAVGVDVNGMYFDEEVRITKYGNLIDDLEFEGGGAKKSRWPVWKEPLRLIVPVLSITTGMEFDVGKKSKIRISPSFRYELLASYDDLTNDHFYSFGGDFSWIRSF